MSQYGAKRMHIYVYVSTPQHILGWLPTPQIYKHQRLRTDFWIFQKYTNFSRRRQYEGHVGQSFAMTLFDDGQKIFRGV